MRYRSLLPLTLILALPVAACSAPEEQEEESGAAVSTRNETGKDFGLEAKEIVLTLDDGPGPRTVELAQWLAEEKVPTTFFMVGKNAKANPEAVKKVAELSASNNSLFLIGNHSNTHTTPLPKQGVNGATDEIMIADGVLHDAINKAQEKLPSVVPFFRPPYGAFTALGAANIAEVNKRGGAKYSGPVFWDIGGELGKEYSADWACWGKVTIDRCTDGYVAETKARGRGIILAHDVHSKTVDMLTGKGSANGRSLIKELRSLGFKFVSLRAHETAVESHAAQEQNLSGANEASIEASIDTSDNGRVTASIKTAGAAKVVAQFDNGTSAVEFNGSKSVAATLAPGSHFLTVTAYDAAGTPVAKQRYTFVIAAPMDKDPNEGDNTKATGNACVNYGNLARVKERGQYFDFFQKEVACNTPGAKQAAPGECYKYKGELRVGKLPMSIGGDEWSIEYDLSYADDPGGASKVSVILETGTGNIVTGKRIFPAGSSRRGATFDESSVDCTNGIWRGTMLPDGAGAADKFRFSKPR